MRLIKSRILETEKKLKESEKKLKELEDVIESIRIIVGSIYSEPLPLEAYDPVYEDIKYFYKSHIQHIEIKTDLAKDIFKGECYRKELEKELESLEYRKEEVKSKLERLP